MANFHDKADGFVLGLRTQDEFWKGIVGLQTNAPFHDQLPYYDHLRFDRRNLVWEFRKDLK